MPRNPRPLLRLMAIALALGFMGGAQGQDAGRVSDYRLPPAPTATPHPAGPVIPEAPVVRSADPRPQPIAPPSPGPSPSPSPTTTATPTTAQRATSAPQPAHIRPTTSPPPASSPAVREPDTTAPSSQAAPVLPAPSQTQTAAAPARPLPVTLGAAAETSWPLLWLTFGGAALVVLAGLLFWGRKRAKSDVRPDEASVPLASTPQQAPAQPLPPPPRHSGSPASAMPSVSLTAEKLLLSFMNARLTYRLTVSNPGSTPTGPITITGDMISAHAAIPRDAQLHPSAQELTLLHRLEDIAPGQSLELDGDIALPLAQVLPIESGHMRMLVPLARFHIARENSEAMTLVFVIGEPAQPPSKKLLPLRLDIGPRTVKPLGQSEIGRSASLW